LHKILIIEDNLPMAEMIRTELELAEYAPVVCPDSSEALFSLQTDHFDLILMDLALRDPTAPDLISKLCGRETPVVFLADPEKPAEQKKNLHPGADGWISKPPEIRELLTGIKAALKSPRAQARYLHYQDIELDLSDRIVLQNGVGIRLTPKEFDLLAFLVRHVDIALSREKILQMVWGYCVAGETRTVDMHIMQLRKKLNFRQKLKSVIKIGYRLDH